MNTFNDLPRASPGRPVGHHRRWPLPSFALLVFAWLLVSERRAAAYIDPGSGSMVYQTALMILLGLGFTLRRTAASISRFVRSRFGNRDAASDRSHPDRL
jgi:hypothetical protein